jgi:hypothetical protein
MVACSAAHADNIGAFAEDFWSWRAVEQPFNSDDIPRIERPPGFAPDWSATAVASRSRELDGFMTRWRTLAPAAAAPVHEQVDYRLIGAALARVHFELEVAQNWKRDPGFYVDQTLGSLHALLIQPAPFSAERQHELVVRLRRIPTTIAAARQNLTDIRRPFAARAIEALDGIGDRLRQSEAALAREFTPANQAALEAATPAAVASLEDFRAWLASRLASARADTALGRAAYLYFLREVALAPYTPEQLLDLSRAEWARSVAFEAYQQARLAGQPPPALFPNAAAQIAAARADEDAIRRFLSEHKILTVPSWLHHYRDLPLPDYLAPLADFGEDDDLTGPSRLGEDATRYISPPRPEMGFFSLASARDPRPIIVHEGVPGHYFQLCLGWNNADPVRRRYYDSGANEGIGFYAEEMLLQAGLFDDDAATRGTIYSFMRLRALRVEVDVKLALGAFTLEQAADYLERTVPMDRSTALAEAATFAATPGQAISYQVGKSQILELLADARRAAGGRFSLLEFNDFVWNNGNVPLSLQRWELLGDASQVPAVEAR